MMKNMANSVFLHERIVTTPAKAKVVKPFVEKISHAGEEGHAAHRRMAFARSARQADDGESCSRRSVRASNRGRAGIAASCTSRSRGWETTGSASSLNLSSGRLLRRKRRKPDVGRANACVANRRRLDR
jgi:hypothetical protein